MTLTDQFIERLSSLGIEVRKDSVYVEERHPGSTKTGASHHVAGRFQSAMSFTVDGRGFVFYEGKNHRLTFRERFRNSHHLRPTYLYSGRTAAEIEAVLNQKGKIVR